MEDHLVAMSDRVDHMALLGTDLPLAAIAAFRALWPRKTVPKRVAELCDWVKSTEARLIEWRDSSGRIGIYTALQVLLSWYDDIDLDSLNTIRANSRFYTDEAAKKELEKKACELREFAGVHSSFFKDVNDPEELGEEDGDADEDEADSEEMYCEDNELLIADEHRKKKKAVVDSGAEGSTSANASASGIA